MIVNSMALGNVLDDTKAKFGNTSLAEDRKVITDASEKMRQARDDSKKFASDRQFL